MSDVVKTDDIYTMYFLVRQDLKMGKGKIAGQVGHGVQNLFMMCSAEQVQQYLSSGIYPKVVLKVQNLEEIIKIQKICIANNITNTIVVDMGLTQIEPHSPTVLAIGPIKKSDVPKEIKELKLL